MIHLDPAEIANVNAERVGDLLAERAKVLYLKPKMVEFEPRHRMKGKGSSLKRVNALESVDGC